MGGFVCLMGVERERERKGERGERQRERGKRAGPGGVFVLLQAIAGKRWVGLVRCW